MDGKVDESLADFSLSLSLPLSFSPSFSLSLRDRRMRAASVSTQRRAVYQVIGFAIIVTAISSVRTSFIIGNLLFVYDWHRFEVFRFMAESNGF